MVSATKSQIIPAVDLPTMSKIAVIDLSGEDLRPGSSSWVHACSDVRRALEEQGSFIAVYKKFPLELHNRVFGAMEELFEDVPKEIKKKNSYEKPVGGYNGDLPQIPLHEAMGITNARDLEEIQKFTNLMWPAGNHHFCETVHSYVEQVTELDRLVTRMIFESYGAHKHYESFVDSCRHLLRFLNYKEPQNNNNNLAFPIHTDKGFTSILHQNHISGLEIMTKDGEWVSFDPSPSSFVVMAADALKVWSNDRVTPCTHRVIMKGNEARYSIGAFSFHKGTIQIPEELVDEEHPLQYKPFDHFGYFNWAVPGGNSKTNFGAKAYCGV